MTIILRFLFSIFRHLEMLFAFLDARNLTTEWIKDIKKFQSNAEKKSRCVQKKRSSKWYMIISFGIYINVMHESISWREFLICCMIHQFKHKKCSILLFDSHWCIFTIIENKRNCFGYHIFQNRFSFWHIFHSLHLIHIFRILWEKKCVLFMSFCQKIRTIISTLTAPQFSVLIVWKADDHQKALSHFTSAKVREF